MTEEGPAGLDLRSLSGYLGTPVSATLIPGGRSNLTYHLIAGGDDLVLRRPPLGHVLATAHDMGREFRVISALAETPVPVPQAVRFCPDDTVIGAPFYLMRRVEGTVFRSVEQTDPLGADRRRELAYTMMDTLAALHSVKPDEVGLGDFGRPDGFLARQVKRWSGQLDKSRSRPLPEVDALRDRLAATIPAPTGPGAIVHGDYRLDNLIVAPDGGEIRAVLDWEMATLGDPLADLGLLLTYWDVLGGPAAAGAAGVVSTGLGPRAGFPDGSRLIERYVAAGGVDVGPLDWHVALGCFKLAVISEGIYYRYTLGQTVGAGFERFAEMAAPLTAHGLAALASVEG
ncbi:phosphotransferase family protein [Asanoa sp. NPDC050611]|uniref:phosphotransferase family protein n=1 Tax=Asanoa sp. NPDC050611 TaxID=3157098 RepID=UPI00340EFA80